MPLVLRTVYMTIPSSSLSMTFPAFVPAMELTSSAKWKTMARCSGVDCENM